MNNIGQSESLHKENSDNHNLFKPLIKDQIVIKTNHRTSYRLCICINDLLLIIKNH